MTVDEVRTCLKNDGWPVEDVSENTMRSLFRSASKVLPLFIHLEASFVTFAVIPFSRLPDDGDGIDLVVEKLLRLNREINMAKFSVDEDGDVILSVEYPLKDLDPSEVRDAVDVLSFYADKYLAEVSALSQP